MMKKGSDHKSQNSYQLGELELSAPTTAAQREIWASIQIDESANLGFNESITISLEGDLEISRLRTALEGFVGRHDTFRSCFTPDGKKFVVYRNPELNFDFKDLSHSPLFTTELEGLRAEATKTQFDLVVGPLYRFTLVKKTETHFYLIITAHHLICDGWSLAVLVNEVSKLYEGEFLPEAQQFCDFSLTHNKKNLSKDLIYWKTELKGAPNGVELPLDFERSDFRTYESERVDYELDREIVQKIQAMAAKNRMSFYHFLFAGFNSFLQKITGQENLVVGISSALQSTYGAHDLVGHLVQLLPIKTNPAEDQTFFSYAQQVKAKMLDANEHSDMTFGEIIQSLEIERIPNRISLVNIIFNVDQQYEGQGFEFREIHARYESNPRFYENFEIFVNATTLKDKCVLECQYNRNLFKKETIQKWLVEFESLLSFFSSRERKLVEYELKNDLIKKSSQIIKGKNKEAKSSLENVNQETLSKIKLAWKEILKRENVEADSNFFQMGGHSLLAMDLVQYFKRVHSFKLSIKDVMLHPSPRELANKIGTLNSTHNLHQMSFELKKEFELSYSQKQAWFLQELSPSSHMFNLPSCIRVKTKVERDKLKEAYKALLTIHPMLRVTFTKGPLQKVLPVNDVLNKLDFEPINSTIDQAKNEMDALAHSVIDIYSAPLFHFKLYKLGEEDFLIFNNFHHIIFDGWSFDIFFRDLNLAYSGQKLEEEKRDFQEFVLEQKGRIVSESYIDRLEQYSQFIASNPLECHYPSDYSRPKNIDNSGETLVFDFSSSEISLLQKFTRDNSMSLYNLFLYCFGLVIAKKAQTKSLYIGTPLRARPGSRDMSTIGYFVNALPVLIETQGSGVEGVRKTQEEVLRTIEHEDIPLEILIQNLKIKRNPAQTAVFQQFFSFQDVNNRDGLFDNQPYTQVNIHKSTTHTDIDMWIKASDSKVEGAIEYRKDLYNQASMLELKNEFRRQVLNLAKGVETQSQLHETKAETFEFDKPIHEYIEDFASKTPLKEAFSSSEGDLNYIELNQLANQYARYFQSQGIRQGNLVGLCAHRNRDLIVSLIALMKLGVGYVPLDPYFPDERLHYMVKHSQIDSVIMHRDLSERFYQLEIEILAFEDINLGKLPNTNLEIPHDENQTLYVIYTSGSTGNPKGVELGWRSVKNFIHSMKERLSTSDTCRLLAVTTLSFDIAVLELYLPLISGGTLVLADKMESIDGEELNRIIEQKAINMMQATPATWRLLLNANFRPNLPFTVLCGGEPFPLDLAQTLLSQNLQVWNMYGPTETTVWSTMKQLKLPLDKITIGSPIHNTEILILNDKFETVPDGEVGELCIAGEGLAKGYFRREDLTQKSFIEKTPYGRIYRTGDLAKRATHGEFVCLGRNDSQVKIRGYRIELGEIETSISQHPEIESVAVIVKEFSDTDKRLIAFYTGYESIEEKSLRMFLQDKIPSYMIPNQFILKSHLPLTLNGKIDKKKLNESITPASSLGFVPETISSDSDEEKLAAIWKELLALSSVKKNDDFFEVGGHSLLAVELFSRLEKEFEVELKLAELVSRSRFEDILAVIRSQKRTVDLEGVNIPISCECLVPIQINNPRKLLFCFHGVGGNILNYRVLKGYTRDYSLIGVQAFGVNGDRALPTSLDEMVDRYVLEITQLQSTGPYLLAGGSMGGTIALAVGQKLELMGEKVESVMMFDTFGPNLEVKVFSENSLFQRLKTSLTWRLRKYYINTLKLYYKALNKKIPHHFRYFDIEIQNYKIMKKHVVSPYSGRVDLIRAPQIEKTSYMDSQLGWSKILLGEFNIYDINGDHENFVEAEELPHVVESIISNIHS